jgi:uncharacterized membrane protein
MKKGTSVHKRVGRVWMVSMLVVAISSFWISKGFDWFYGYGPIHLLSLWVIFCVCISTYSAKTGNINAHKRYAVGAYIGSIGASFGALLVPDRLLYNVFFG